MKYRILTDEELKELESEFKHFLISNDISSEEWEKINNNNPNKAIQFVEVFSDIVMDKALKNTKFLEHRSISDLKVFKFDETKAYLIALKAKSDIPQVDFSTPESIQKSILNYINQIDIYTANKIYSESREQEIFKLIQQGCVASEASFWDKLNQLL